MSEHAEGRDTRVSIADATTAVPADGAASHTVHHRKAPHMPLTVSDPDLLRNGDDADFRRLVHSLLSFSTRLQEIRNTFGTYLGLTGTQYTVLISIAHLSRAGGVGVKQVANHLGLSGAFITGEVKKLEQEGLVSKQTNPADRRRVILSVTAGGVARLTSLTPIQCPTNDTLFKALTAKDFDSLLGLCDGLVAGAKDALSLVRHLTSNHSGVKSS